MAYPKSRSATAELHEGASEGSHDFRGKDWGGVPGGFDPHDCGCPANCGCGCARGECTCPHDELAMAVRAR